jgi:2-polyprenyl-3-methyl-5-hydroxy-6-metoxy-1,4-benzoquinol methylase
MAECIACSSPMVRRFTEMLDNHMRCPKCGLECVSPQPDNDVLAEIYNESYFSHYQNEIDPRMVRSMKRATYARQFKKLPSPESFGEPRRLLDCGAATGFLAELAKDMGWDSYAVELSEFGAQSCEKLLGKEHVFCGEIQHALFGANPEGRFEVITMFDFIEHVRNPRDILSQARERLNLGGVLLLTTPRVGSISWHLMGKQWFHYVREHLWFFNPQSIRALLIESGFSTVEIHALQKAIAIDYMLAYYGRKTTYSRLFSPMARALNAFLPAQIKRQRAWFYLGEMVVLARASEHANVSTSLTS